MSIWKEVKLAEVCEIFNGSTPSRKNPDFWGNGEIPWFTIEDIRTQGRQIFETRQSITEAGFKSSSLKLLPKNSVLLCCTASVGEYAMTRVPLTTNQQFNGMVVRDKEILHPEFLYYFASTLMDKLISISGKATINFVSMTKLRNLEIPLPPLPEQKRIVVILDKAFAAIDQAKANIEKNIENAEELFQSKLNEVFSQKGEGWEEKRFSECLKLKSGDGLTAKNMVQSGEYPVYGGNGIAGNHDTFNLDEHCVIVGRVGALCGNARFIDEPIWLTDNAFKVSLISVEFEKRFLTILLNHVGLRKYARQAAQPVISNSSLKDIILKFPSGIDEQKRIVQIHEMLGQSLSKLEGEYRKKILALEEFKKSLLQKAFSGELTEKEVLV